jgi:anti-sigma factor RsiW
MSCQQAQKQFMALIEGELNHAERQDVEAHVTACPACTADLQALKQTFYLARIPEVPEPSEEFWAGFVPALRQRIRVEEAERPARRRPAFWHLFVLPKPALVALAASLVLISSFILLQWNRRQEEVPPSALSMVEEMSLAANLDLLRDLELLEDVELLERLDLLQRQKAG